MKFLVRCCVDYSILVEASSEDEAHQITEDTPFSDPAWEEAVSCLECEEVE